VVKVWVVRVAPVAITGRVTTVAIEAGAVLTKLVPSDTRKFPDVPAVAGYVAVDHVGAAAPADRNICPDDPAADTPNAEAVE
jgi:hypothetical protein